MSKFTPDTPVSELHVEFIEHSPQYYDWEDTDWTEEVQVFSAETCDECGELCVMDEVGSNQHCDWLRDEDDEDYEDFDGPVDTYDVPIAVGMNVQPYSEFGYRLDGNEAYIFDLDDVPEDAEVLTVTDAQPGVVTEVSVEGGNWRVSVKFASLPDIEFFFLRDGDHSDLQFLEVIEDEVYDSLKPRKAKDCTNTLYNEGPMMNYRYDIDSRRVGGPREAAAALARLPLCLVVFEGNDEYLALTGGGMDLSWEICEAYMRLGYLPPAHFIDLPGMAGKSLKDPDDRWVIEGCMRTAEVQMRWAGDRLERLKEYRERMRKDDERREQRGLAG